MASNPSHPSSPVSTVAQAAPSSQTPSSPSPDRNRSGERLRLWPILRFFWNATRGHRLRPWLSPYLRWRLETYTGKRAELVGAADFVQLLRSEPRQFLRFLAWVGRLSA